MPKTCSNFILCDMHYANYVQGCKGKLSSQNQDQSINKRIHHITPNQMNYITSIITLLVIKKKHMSQSNNRMLILWNQQRYKILPILTLQGQNCESRLKTQFVQRSKTSLPKT